MALAAYATEYQPTSVECLGDAGGFSGARFWRLQSSRGPLCLRRWPSSHPAPETLEFIHSVLWFVQREGVDLVPVPIPTIEYKSYVEVRENRWELAPWLPGRADFHDPSHLEGDRTNKLRAAMVALARFHSAAADFPVVDAGPSTSPGIVARLRKLRELKAGKFAILEEAIRDAPWPDSGENIAECARRIVQLAPQAAATVEQGLEKATRLKVRISPCIRDIWSEHVLFEGDLVTGLVDFGAMRPENVASDISRLLGSLARDSRELWDEGFSAYESVRLIEPEEYELIRAMDQSGVLMSGLNWIDWIFLERRTFDRPRAILGRLEENEIRLRRLVDSLR